MIGPNVRCEAELVGLAQDVRNAMEWDGGSSVGNAAMTKKRPEVLRRERVRQVWWVSPVEARTAREVLFFCKWLQKCHPEFAPAWPGDLYQRLKKDLTGLCKYTSGDAEAN